MLCEAYISVSQDPIKGMDQSSDTLWTAIERLFSAKLEALSRTPDRNRTAVKNRFYDISKATTKYATYYNKILIMNESGATPADQLSDARDLFLKLEGKDFSLMHTFDILRKVPR